MQLGRRDLLSLGAAVAVTMATSSCRNGDPRPDARETTIPSAAPAKRTPTASRSFDFPGRPPAGSLYYGASVPYHRSLSAWERELDTSLALHRSYFTQDRNETGQLVQRCRVDLAHGRLPHVSVKATATWQEVAAGAQDEWLAKMLGPLGAESRPLFFTLHHEPENDAGRPGMQPHDYVAMQQRVIRLAAELAPQVTIVPILQQWTFDPMGEETDPAAWIVPEASVIGLDLYNPWSPTNGKAWRSFSSKADEVIGWFGDTPLAIGEYGCRNDPANPGLAAEWLRDAAAYARTHNIVSMSYFNSGVGSPDGSWELGGATEQAFAELLASDWVVRPR
jgi:hypothetical protein